MMMNASKTNAKMAINDRGNIIVPNIKNDIFRKFQKQFRYLLSYPYIIDDSLYVEQSSNYYDEKFTEFVEGLQSEVRFFVGYTGTGKTTFIRHYFGMTNSSPITFKNKAIVIPSFWNGVQLNDENYKATIEENISRVFNSTLSVLNYDAASHFPLHDLHELKDYIIKTRGDILAKLTIEEKMQCYGDIDLEYGRILDKTESTRKVEYASSCLKYFIETYAPSIERVILVIDDVETLTANKLNALIDAYFHVYNCLHNTSPNSRFIVNLLISLRPHSFRYLRRTIPHEMLSSYGNYLENYGYVIVRNDIPSIQNIFNRRFENAIKNTNEPGNKDSWDVSLNALYSIVNKFENQYANIVFDLCHMNIRAIMDCFQMILSNRIWCQDSKYISQYPAVNESEYDFNNIVNIIRTLSCGESAVYLGGYNVQTNPNRLNDFQPSPALDNSDAFIPNLLVNFETRECDIVVLYTMLYMEHLFASDEGASQNTEFISVEDLVNTISVLLRIDSKVVFASVEYLFKNRILRKSIYDTDSDATINRLNAKNYVYFTKKGSRLLQMLSSDCILLELFREDMVRDYSSPAHYEFLKLLGANQSNVLDFFYKTSKELVTEKKRHILFADLIVLAHEVYQKEDSYVSLLGLSTSNVPLFETFGYLPVTLRIIAGIENSLYRSQSVDMHNAIIHKLVELKSQVCQRIRELLNQ